MEPLPIIIPKSKDDIYADLMRAYRDMKALERAKELAVVCDSCEAELEKHIERSNAVAEAMAELLKLECPTCKANYKASRITYYEVAKGKCTKCGAIIGSED